MSTSPRINPNRAQRGQAHRTAKAVARRAAFFAPLTALGVVFGDIATSPIYAARELILRSGSVKDPEHVIGAISLIIWILTLVVTLKYVMIVLRADDHEEGGVFALLALLKSSGRRWVRFFAVMLVFGAGLVLGDGIITPAISILSAIEGIEVVTPAFQEYTVPITVAILVVLFSVQHNGTKVMGKWFGPVTLLWCGFLAFTGAHAILKAPDILVAFNPWYAISYLQDLSLKHLAAAVGAVVLVVTGGEALFSDLGHIGKKPIRQAWLIIVFPSLLLNYLGQGAHVLSGGPTPSDIILFSMVPTFLVIPSVVLATLATIIASQALITAAYSLIAQGIALKYLPKMSIRHTDDEREGEQYLPIVNWLLFFGCVLLTVSFQTSGRLAHAYGVAVAVQMVITTLAIAAIARVTWHWKRSAVLALFAPMLVIDITMALGSLTKVPKGGYVPLAVAIAMLTIMSTWKWGRAHVQQAFRAQSTMTMDEMLAIKLRSRGVSSRPMVLLTKDHASKESDPVPPLLEIFLKRHGFLPDQLVLLTIRQTRQPYVSNDQRYQIIEFENTPKGGRLFLSVLASYGFRETPNILKVIDDIAHDEELPGAEQLQWLVLAGRDRVVIEHRESALQRLRFRFFHFLSRHSEPAYSYFGLDEDARLMVEFVTVKI